jgi:hypothetical protein
VRLAATVPVTKRLTRLAAFLAAALSWEVARADDTTRFARGGPHATVRGGYGLRSLYGLPIDAGVLSLGLGGSYRSVAVYLSCDLLFGSTREGLAVRSLAVGPQAEFAIGHLRLGGGPYLAVLAVERVTTAATLSELTFGGRAHLTADVAPLLWTGGAFFGVELTAAVGKQSLFYGPSLVVGVRAF